MNDEQSLARSAERLKIALKERKLSYIGAESITGIFSHILSQYTKGKRAVTERHAVLLTTALGHSPEYWLGKEQKRVATGDIHPLTGEVKRW
jgi:transcriptional regulator with XRE-family HTH domain